MVLTQKAVLLVNALQQGDKEYENAKALVLQALQDLMRIFQVVPVAELVHDKGPHGSKTDELGTELSDLIRHGEIGYLKRIYLLLTNRFIPYRRSQGVPQPSSGDCEETHRISQDMPRGM